MLSVIIPFESGAPVTSEIFEQLKSRTGLSLECTVLYESDDACAVTFPGFGCMPMIECFPDKVYINVFIGENSYIFWATIATVVQMGGTYPGKIPEYASARWDSLTHIHEEIKNAKMNGLPEGTG